jgi:hypothetical protein
MLEVSTGAVDWYARDPERPSTNSYVVKWVADEDDNTDHPLLNTLRDICKRNNAPVVNMHIECLTLKTARAHQAYLSGDDQTVPPASARRILTPTSRRREVAVETEGFAIAAPCPRRHPLAAWTRDSTAHANPQRPSDIHATTESTARNPLQLDLGGFRFDVHDPVHPDASVKLEQPDCTMDLQDIQRRAEATANEEMGQIATFPRVGAQVKREE